MDVAAGGEILAPPATLIGSGAPYAGGIPTMDRRSIVRAHLRGPRPQYTAKVIPIEVLHREVLLEAATGLGRRSAGWRHAITSASELGLALARVLVALARVVGWVALYATVLPVLGLLLVLRALWWWWIVAAVLLLL